MKRFDIEAIVDGAAKTFEMYAASRADASNQLNYILANSGAVYTIIKG